MLCNDAHVLIGYLALLYLLLRIFSLDVGRVNGRILKKPITL